MAYTKVAYEKYDNLCKPKCAGEITAQTWDRIR